MRSAVAGVIKSEARKALEEGLSADYRDYMIICQSMQQRGYGTVDQALDYAQQHGIKLSLSTLMEKLVEKNRYWRWDAKHERIYIVSQKHFGALDTECPCPPESLVDYKTFQDFLFSL